MFRLLCYNDTTCMLPPTATKFTPGALRGVQQQVTRPPIPLDPESPTGIDFKPKSPSRECSSERSNKSPLANAHTVHNICHIKTTTLLCIHRAAPELSLNTFPQNSCYPALSSERSYVHRGTKSDTRLFPVLFGGQDPIQGGCGSN